MSKLGKASKHELVVAKGWGGWEREGESLLMGIGFPLGVMKMF